MTKEAIESNIHKLEHYWLKNHKGEYEWSTHLLLLLDIYLYNNTISLHSEEQNAISVLLHAFDFNEENPTNKIDNPKIVSIDLKFANYAGVE